MPDWLSGSLSADPELALLEQAIRLFASLILGIGVAIVFRFSHGRTHDRAAMLTTTLILLSTLISMVSMVIGESVAMAFSLVGALSIVRFRTVVEDTRDTAFVIFAVVVGMGAGTGQMMVPLIGLPVVGLTAILLSRLPGSQSGQSAVLTVRLGLGRSAAQLLNPVLTRHGITFRLTAASTTRQGSAVELSYSVRLLSAEKLILIVSELNQIEGIQNVELRIET